jgi:hypothetical protein
MSCWIGSRPVRPGGGAAPGPRLRAGVADRPAAQELLDDRRARWGCHPRWHAAPARPARWDTDGVAEDLRDYVVDHLGDPGAVLMIGETGDVKKGSRTVGVQRQYTGAAGRIENSQLAVYLTYSGVRGHALIDRELYLPKSWTDDPGRCAATGVPFATKPALPRAMLIRALDAGMPAAWVTGDEVYGADLVCAPRSRPGGSATVTTTGPGSTYPSPTRLGSMPTPPARAAGGCSPAATSAAASRPSTVAAQRPGAAGPAGGRRRTPLDHRGALPGRQGPGRPG